jgi:hypothetical protein
MRPVPPRAPRDFEENQMGATPPQRQFNTAKARKDAEDLAALADKIPGEVDKVSSQLLPRLERMGIVVFLSTTLWAMT